MAPSVKKLSAAFPHLSPAEITQIRGAMHLAEAAPYQDRPKLARLAMRTADSVLGTYGVEHIRAGRGKRSPAVTYCNTGDTYGTTVLYVNGGFRVGSWGNVVERGNYE